MKFTFSLGLIWIFCSLLLSCKPWSSETNRALKLAGENGEELKKVLNYYRDTDPNTLKFKAAEYLISNMIFQYSRSGPGVDSLDKSYQYVYGVYRHNRNTAFMSDSLKQQRSARIFEEFDLMQMTSEQMIAQIESAFETYQRYEWTQLYSFELFCEYILPYKIGHSANMDWRGAAREKYGALVNYSALMEEDSHHEAEWYAPDDDSRIKIHVASGGHVYELSVSGEKEFEFTFDTKQKGVQLLEIYYFNGHSDGVRVKAVIDEVAVGEIIFPSTGAWDRIDPEVPPVRIHKDLDKGSHTLKLVAQEKSIYLDHITTPKNLNLELPNSVVREGKYYLSNGSGELLVDTAALDNGYMLQLEANPTERSPIEIIESGKNFYQIVLGESGDQYIIDAAPEASSEFVQTYINYGGDNQTWIFYPVDNGGYQIRNKSTKNILAYNEENNELIQLPPDKMQEEFIWYLEKAEEDNSAVQRDPSNQILRTARQISNITDEFHWSGSYVSIGPLPHDHLLEYAYGTCVEETNFQTMILRSMGIACAVDFIFNYPERNAGHSWSVVFDAEGNTIQNNCHNPVGAGTWVDVFAKGKVYRKTNTINRESLFIQNNGQEAIPREFSDPYFKDVTDEYCETRDIEVSIPPDLVDSPNHFGYLMVFNNARWVVIGWGERTRNNTVKFENLEPRGMYLPAFYNNGDFEAFNDPFYFDSIKNIQPIKVSKSDTQRLVLKRKFPNRLVNESHHRLIIGGEFQGANRSDFSDAVVLGTISPEMLEPIFHHIDVDENKPFKYLRYIGPDEGHCNINEISFFDSEGAVIKGKVIGTEGSLDNNGKTKDKAFDGDVLTYFEAPEPSGGWVGLELDQSKAISSIRFAARNDGNMVEPGDEYELFYWGDKHWESMGRQIPDADSLVYRNVPMRGLYHLKNHTKGWEERIFTWNESLEQVWW